MHHLRKLISVELIIDGFRPVYKTFLDDEKYCRLLET